MNIKKPPSIYLANVSLVSVWPYFEVRGLIKLFGQSLDD
jgi:hypothetical protein